MLTIRMIPDGERMDVTRSPHLGIARYQISLPKSRFYRDDALRAQVFAVVGRVLPEGRIWEKDGALLMGERKTERGMIAIDHVHRKVYVYVGSNVRAIERLRSLGGRRIRKPVRPWEW